MAPEDQEKTMQDADASEEEEETLDDLEDLFDDGDVGIPILEEQDAKKTESSEQTEDEEEEEYEPQHNAFPDPFTLVLDRAEELFKPLGVVAREEVIKAELDEETIEKAKTDPESIPDDIANLLGIELDQKSGTEEENKEDEPQYSAFPSEPRIQASHFLDHKSLLDKLGNPKTEAVLEALENEGLADNVDEFGVPTIVSKIENDEAVNIPTQQGEKDEFDQFFESQTDDDEEEEDEKTDQKDDTHSPVFPETCPLNTPDIKTLTALFEGLGAYKDFEEEDASQEKVTAKSTEGLPQDVADLLNIDPSSSKTDAKRGLDSFFDDIPSSSGEPKESDQYQGVMPEKDDLFFPAEKPLRDIVLILKGLGNPDPKVMTE